jgi:predicted deacetylase
MTTPTKTEARHAECKRRFQRSNAAWTDERFAAWLTDALSHGAQIVLELDDHARAEYPRQPATHADS